MKKKKLLKIAIVLIALPFLCLGLYIGYVFSDFNKDIDTEQVEFLVSEIKSAKRQN